LLSARSKMITFRRPQGRLFASWKPRVGNTPTIKVLPALQPARPGPGRDARIFRRLFRPLLVLVPKGPANRVLLLTINWLSPTRLQPDHTFSLWDSCRRFGGRGRWNQGPPSRLQVGPRATFCFYSPISSLYAQFLGRILDLLGAPSNALKYQQKSQRAVPFPNSPPSMQPTNNSANAGGLLTADWSPPWTKRPSKPKSSSWSQGPVRRIRATNQLLMQHFLLSTVGQFLPQ